MAVIVDAQPDHVPTGVVAVADAEDGKFSLSDGFARAPVEGEGSALRVDVSGSPVGEELVVAALQIRALSAAGKDFDVLEEVGCGVAASCVVGVEAVVA